MSVIIYYYADWCPHCNKFTPIYQEVKNKFKQLNDLHFVEINYDNSKVLTDFDYVKEFPTLNLVKNKTVIELEKYTKEGLIEFIKTETQR